MEPAQLRASVLLSTQRALLGHIGTAVRKILCRWTENEIHLRVVFDGEVSEVDVEAISEAETEVIADFPLNTAVFSGLSVVIVPHKLRRTIVRLLCTTA